MNHINILTATRSRLLSLKESYRREYEERCQKIDEQVKAINAAIETINKAAEPYVCPHCNGSGSVRVPDAAGQMEETTCSKCRGTGIKIT